MSVCDSIVSDARVEVLTNLGDGRVLARLPIGLIKLHPTLTKIRGKSPDKLDRLQASMKDTGNAAVYPVLIYASATREHDEKDSTAGEVSPYYYIADGHQRFQAAKNNKNASIIAQIVTRWDCAEKAFHDCVSIQYARFEMKEIDLFSILKEGKLSDQELIGMTGKSDTTIGRMRKVCHYPTVVGLIDKECITTNIAARLIDACKKNNDRIAALLATLDDKQSKYQKEADHFENRFKAEGRPKSRKVADMAKLSYYFKTEKWDNWEAVLGTDAFVNPDTGLLNLDGTAAPKAQITVVETATPWEEEIAIYFQGGQKHSDMTLQNLVAFHDSLDDVKAKMAAIIKRRKEMEAAKKHPIPAGNPKVDVAAPEAPKTQSANMQVEA